ncbi:MAG: lysophospholipid acyltransferase family protein [Christensenellales bacterium]|jgi:1-acyl-sn-glycerol-3-phosphate acyltransferase
MRWANNKVPDALMPTYGLQRFAKAVLYGHHKIFFGLRVHGAQNLDGLENTGLISICNHVHMLDCAMLGSLFKSRPVAFPTLQQNLDMFFVGRYLVRNLGGFPVAGTVAAQKTFNRIVEKLLDDGTVVHFFPEGHRIDYDTRLREFQRGAFYFAYRCRVPIVPMIITFREKDGIRRLFRRKPSIDLHVLPPVYPDTSAPAKAEIARLHAACREAMEQIQRKYAQEQPGDAGS